MTFSETRLMSATLPYGGRLLLGLPITPCRGVVIFTHGAGTGLINPCSGFIAKSLQRAGLATVLVDLLTDDEAIYHERSNLPQTDAGNFGIPFLAERLGQGIAWTIEHLARYYGLNHNLPLGFFASGNAAAAALLVAAQRTDVNAVVSGDGRPDLANNALTTVRAATLLIVGEENQELVAQNQRAFRQLRCPRAIEIVPGTAEWVEKPAALETVVQLSRFWFLRYLVLNSVETNQMAC